MPDTDPMDTADAAAAELTRYGDDWAQHLPEDATIFDSHDPYVFDTVKLSDGTLIYRRTTDTDDDYRGAAPYWVAVGWSDASKARRYRPIPADLRPFTFDEHDEKG